jgi:hypothetical protein
MQHKAFNPTVIIPIWLMFEFIVERISCIALVDGNTLQLSVHKLNLKYAQLHLVTYLGQRLFAKGSHNHAPAR